MDPVTLGTLSTIATVGSTAIGMGTSIMNANAEAEVLEQQAADEQRRAQIQQENANKVALEERVVGQQKAANRMREARLAQSKLVANAGASGGSASDPTVLDLWADIESEGRFNEGQEFAAADQKAKGITYQASLDRWTADRNAAIKRASANTTRIGGYGDAFGKGFGMIAKYGGFKSGSTRAYG